MFEATPQPPGNEAVPAAPAATNPAGPWRRFLARFIDLWALSPLMGWLLGMALGMAWPGLVPWMLKPGAGVLSAWLVLPFALLAETLIFGLTGTTPGKALLGVKVTTLHGIRPTVAQYARRQWGVWWHGLATGFPLLNLWAMERQFQKVSRQGWTLYDQGTFNVTAGRLNVLRKLAVIVGIGVLFVSHAVFKQQEQQTLLELSQGPVWINEVTGKTAKLPAGWMHENGSSDEVHVFLNPEEGARIIFGMEYTDGTLALEEYVDLWLKAVAGDMNIRPNGVRGAIYGLPAWHGDGHLTDDLTQQVEVTFFQRGRQMWRIVTIATTRGGGTDRATIVRARTVLAETLETVSEKPAAPAKGQAVNWRI